MANEKGTALCEILPALLVIKVLLVGCLMVGYLFFARSWITFQVEQALYCTLEGKPHRDCATRMGERIKWFLPFGEFRLSHLSGSRFTAELRGEWRLGQFRRRFHNILRLDSRRSR